MVGLLTGSQLTNVPRYAERREIDCTEEAKESDGVKFVGSFDTLRELLKTELRAV